MEKIKFVRKRDGRIERFDKRKIERAISKAFKAINKKSDKRLIKNILNHIISFLYKEYKGKIPSVEEIQDIVENTLIKFDLSDVAKAYILYRHKRAEVRMMKEFFGVKDDLKLGINAIKVLERRYLQKDEEGNTIETPSQLFRRVAKAIAEVERMYGKSDEEIEKIALSFYKIMSNLEFLPNSPCLMNAGTKLGNLSACFVLPIEDSIESIFQTLKTAAIIHKEGGGTGFSFSKIRPKGDVVRSTGGIASGPISFMKIFDKMTEEIKQGGRRRGANMGILSVYHPDIFEFINSKSKQNQLENFNISVAVDDKFMKAVLKDKEIELINPRNKKVVKRVKAREIFDLIVYNAWLTGDPGLIFLDEINRKNPTKHLGRIEATNPCGEVPLHENEACNLGSINLSKFVEDNKFNWKKLKEIIPICIRFLDNVIDANRYPNKEIEKMVKGNRRIGLGIMGFADCLLKLGIPYDSKKALKFAEKVMKFIRKEAIKASQALAKEKGSFPNFKNSDWQKNDFKYMRNATLTSMAPTGTISIIANCSSGIEPLFAIVFVRNVMSGVKLLEVNNIFEEIAKKRKFYSNQLISKIAESGSVQKIEEVPKDLKRIFVTALDIEPEWHVRMQAAFQKYVDNSVSKTVNLGEDATPQDIRRIFILAWKLKCKGITVYRYGSKPNQVLTIGKIDKMVREKHVIAESEYAGGHLCSICP